MGNFIFESSLDNQKEAMRSLNLKRDYQLSLLELLELKLQHVLQNYSLEYENEISTADRGYIDESLDLLVEASYPRAIYSTYYTKVIARNWTTSNDEPVNIQDAQGRIQWTLSSNYSRIAYSSDGRRAVQVSDDNKIELYDSQGNRKGIFEYLGGKSPEYWNNDDNVDVLKRDNKKLIVWDAYGMVLATYEPQDKQQLVSALDLGKVLLNTVQRLFEIRKVRKTTFLTLVKDAIKKRSQEQS